MSDLISRQQAIDVIDKEQKEIDVSDVSAMYAYSKCKTIIKQLPSALSTNLAEVGTDCISRQAAIDALGDMPEGDDDFDTGCRQQWNWDTEAIKALPSAQPKNENLKFLEFLWNTINPNEMEQYLEMYSSKEVKSNG